MPQAEGIRLWQLVITGASSRETMPGTHDAPAPDATHLIGAGLPPGRLEELQPRLQALLADFAHMAELETADLEPLPVFVAAQAAGDRHA